MRKILNIWNKPAYSKWIVNLYFKTLLSVPWLSVSPYFHFAPVEMKKEWKICHQIQSRRRKSLLFKLIKIKLDYDDWRLLDQKLQLYPLLNIHSGNKLVGFVIVAFVMVKSFDPPWAECHAITGCLDRFDGVAFQNCWYQFFVRRLDERKALERNKFSSLSKMVPSSKPLNFGKR